MYILPENYVAPEPSAPFVPSAGQRAALKNKMKQYINNKGVPVSLQELIKTAVAFVIENHGVHLHDSLVKEIALEIQEEWHPAPVEEE